MDIKGLVYSILEYKKNKDTSHLQLIEIYKKQIKHDIIAAFEMSHDIIRENQTLFLNSPSFLTFLLKLIDNDNSLSFVMTRGPFRSHSEPVKTTDEITSLQQKLETLEAECESLRSHNENLKSSQTQYQKEIESQRKKMVEAEENHTLKTQLEALKNENNKLKSHIATLKNEKANLQEKLDQFTGDDSDSLREQIEKLERQLQECLTKTEQQKSTIDKQEKLHESLSQAKSERENSLQQHVDDYLKQIEDEKLKSLDLQRRLDECLRQHEKDRSDISEIALHGISPKSQKTLFTMLYNFLLTFNGDNSTSISNMFQYLEKTLADTLARLENDYRLLRQWAHLNFNIQQEDFSVTYLVSNSGFRISSIENVCLNNAPTLTDQQALGLSQELQETRYIAQILKQQFGEELLKHLQSFPAKLQQIALESDMYQKIKSSLTPIFGKPVMDRHFFEKIQKVIQFVLQVLNYMEADRFSGLPENFYSLRNNILLSPSPVVTLPGNDSMLSIPSMAAEQITETPPNSQLQSNLDACMQNIEQYKSSLELFKNKLATCETDISMWKNKYKIETQKFQNETQKLKEHYADEISMLQNKSEEITRLHEDIGVLQLQLDRCLAEKKQSQEENQHLKSVTENEDFREALKAKNHSINELADKMQTLENENKKLKTALQQQRNEQAKIYANEKAQHEMELKQCLDKKIACLNENEKLVANLNDLTENISVLSEENKKLKSSLQEKTENEKNLEQEKIQTLRESSLENCENLDDFKNDESCDMQNAKPTSRKRKPRSQDTDIYTPISDLELSETPLHDESDFSLLPQYIREKNDMMTELDKCQKELEYYKNTYKDANYISTHNQDETALNVANLKSLFVAFFVYYFQRRADNILRREEENIQVLNQLKELLDKLGEADKNEYNSILYFYVRKQISSFTDEEWPAHLQHVTNIETLLQVALTETKRQLKNQSIETGLNSFFRKTFHAFIFPKESNMESIKKILQYLKSICNTNVVIKMEKFLKELDTISSFKYAELTGKSKRSKRKFILHVVSSFHNKKVIESDQ